MTAPLVDDLPLLAPPDRAAGPLRVSGPARDAPFLLLTRRAEVVGREREGVEAVEADGVPVLAALELAPSREDAEGHVGVSHGPSGPTLPRRPGPAAPVRAAPGRPEEVRVRLTPTRIDREIGHGEESLTETVWLPPDLPGAWLQWEPAGRPPLRLRLRWRVPRDGGTVPEPQVRGTELRVPGSAGRPTRVFVVRPEPRWSWSHGDGGLRVEAAVEAASRAEAAGEDEDLGADASSARAVRLLALAVASGAGDALAARLHHPAALRARDVRQAAAWAGERLTVEGDGGWADLLTWSVARLAGAGAVRPGDPLETLWTGLACLASGAPEPAIAAAESALSDEVESPALAAVGVLLAGRWVLSTGRPDRLRGLRPRIDGALEAAGGGTNDRVLAVLRVAGLEAATDAVEGLGDRDWAERLSAARDEARARLARSPASRAAAPPRRILHLPVAGGAGPGRAAGAAEAAEGSGPRVSRPEGGEALARLLRVVLEVPGAAPAPPDPVPMTGPHRAAPLEAWAAWVEGRDRAAAEGLRRHEEAGRAGARWAWSGTATPPGRPGPFVPSWRHDPAAAALGILAVAHGLLGLRSDACFGRLRLAPSFPQGLQEAEVRNVRTGDAVVELGYRRAGRRHTFVLRQTKGRVPLMLVFEPRVPSGRIEAVRVDGEAAELERFVLGERSGVRLQLPLDKERSVRLDASPA